MKKSLILFACLAAWCFHVAAQGSIARYEWWVDGDFASRTAVTQAGTWTASLNLSALHEGLHRLEYQAVDNEGRRSAVAVRHFIKAVPDPTTTATTLQRYEYWFDGDKDNATSGEIGAGGIVTLALELADMHPGLHKFECRVFDSAQQTSATMVKYFIVRDLSSLEEITPNLIAKYAYWFNHGKRVEFVVDPPTPTINVTNQVIELKDIVPNMVGEDYEFDLAKKLLYVTDDVLVAVQVFDKYGTGSVPDTTTVHDFEVKGSLEWVIRGPEMPVDFYDEQGNRLQPVLIQKDEEATIWGMRIPTAVVYAIARDAEVNYFIDDESSVELVYFNADPGDVNRDGQITAVDLSIVVNIIAGLDNAALYRGRADVNRDGEITAADIGMIVNIIAGLGN